MSAPLQSSSVDNNSAVFESASSSPAVAGESQGASPLSNSGEESASLAISPGLEDSESSEKYRADSGEAETARVPPPVAASPPPPAPESASAPVESTITSIDESSAGTPSNISYEPAPTANPPVARAPKGRSAPQMERDKRAKEFRARVNPIYLKMFEGIPPASRPKGFPAPAARQAIEMSPEEQKSFVKNIADERKNAIEVKLGKKTRKVNPSTLKDIESILKMSEQALIEKQPRSKALIRMFGRETRRIARNYTSENINTLVTPSRPYRKTIKNVINNVNNRNVNNTNANNRNMNNRNVNNLNTRRIRNKNNVLSLIESRSQPKGSLSRRNVSAYGNISPPAYND